MQGGTERGIIEHTKRRRRRRRGGMDHGWKDYGFRFTSLSQPVTRVVGLFSRIGGGWLKLEGGRGRERSLQAELLALTPSARAGEGEGERFPSGWVENLARPLPPLRKRRIAAVPSRGSQPRYEPANSSPPFFPLFPNLFPPPPSLCFCLHGSGQRIYVCI